jgi:hypothetical protein
LVGSGSDERGRAGGGGTLRRPVARVSRASVDGTTNMSCAEVPEDASSRRFRERAEVPRRRRLLQDAAEALRWSARGKDEEERRLTREAFAALSHRLAFALALVLPPLVALVADGAATRALLRDWGFETVTRFPEYAADPSWRLAVLLLGVERACYTVMWTAPAAVSRACRVVSRGAWTPVDLTVALFAVNKILQATAYFGFWHVAANDLDAIRTDDGDVRPRALSRLALGLPLVLAGQVLNAATYAAIGRDGVYYGCRFGRPVPWHTGFPFTVVSHPQYAGATMTAWGTCALLANRAVVRRGWFGIAAAQSAYYLYMSLVEANVAPMC